MGFGAAMGGFVAGMTAAEKDQKEQEVAKSKLAKGMYTGNTVVELETKSIKPDSPMYPESVLAEESRKISLPVSVNNDVNATLMEGLKYKQYDIPAAAHGKNKPSSIVTHRTAGKGFHPDDTRLTEKGLGAHYTILADGTMAAVNSPNDKMWHAGPKGNANSLGIEVTGRYDKEKWADTGGWEPMTEEQKTTLGTFGKKVIDYYGISKDSIKPHYKLAAKSGAEGQTVADYLGNLYE